MKPADELTDALLARLPELYPAWVWRNARYKGPARGKRKGGKDPWVDAGRDGQGDITGTLQIEWAGRTFGVRLEIEVKAGKDVMSLKQKAFAARCRKEHAFYVIAKDVDGCLAEVGRLLCAF